VPDGGDAQALADIVAATQRVGTFLAGMDQAGFEQDERTQAAVLFQIVIIGEAAKRLSNEARIAHPTVPWHQVTRMRDFVAHQYHKIDLEVLWNTASRSIPVLLQTLMTQADISPGTRTRQEEDA
jgi:uncharacterized protein with HEPN domain